MRSPVHADPAKESCRRVFSFLGLSGLPRRIDTGQVCCPGVEVFDVDEGSLPELPGDQPFCSDFFPQLGQADAGRLSCFVDTVGNAVGQARQRAAAVVGGNDGFAKRRLVQPLLDSTQGIAPFERGLRRRQRPLIERAKRHTRFQRATVPPRDEGRQYGLIAAGCYTEEINDG
jgi:hypothetical protein